MQESQAQRVAELRKSKAISGPMNFSHVAHMGPSSSFGPTSSAMQDAKEIRRSRVISGPSNFAHVAHIGPEQTKPQLVDLQTAQV